MFKLIVAGLGWWGKVVIQRLSSSNLVTVVSLIEPNPDDECILLAKKFNIPILKDFNHAVYSTNYDGIILCTPNSYHKEQTILCANRGKHVFCEKPLSLIPSDVEQMINVCNTNNVLLGVGHERRFENGWQKIKKLIMENSLGKIMFAEGHFSHDKLANLPLDNWRTNPEIAPAAGMTGMGIHLTDLMIWLFGPVKNVFASTGKRALEYKTGDVVTASLIHADGLSTQITAILKTPHYQRVTIFGENGWVELVDSSHPDTPGHSEMIIRMNDRKIEKLKFEWRDTVSANIHNFAEAATNKQKYLFTDEEKYQNIAVLDAIKISSLNKKVVSLH